MQAVVVENMGGLARKVHVEVPKGRVSAEIDNRLQRMTKTTKLKGFRPGKVPLTVIKRCYSVQVRKEVVGELVQSAFHEVVTQENLKPVGLPKIDDLVDESGKNLSFTAIFEIFPEIKLNPVSALKFECHICDITDREVTDMIQSLRKQRCEQQTVKRAAKENDILNIDFEGWVNGETFEGGKSENYLLELGSKHFIEGFEAGLIGKSAGETIILNLNFPEDYANQKLKGQAVQFKVKINSVNKSILPKLNAEFMARFGVKSGDETAFRNEIRSNMEREVKLTLSRQLKDRVLAGLYEANTIELPQALVERETHRIYRDMEDNFKRQGLESDAITQVDPALFGEQAKKQVSLQLIVTEIIRQNKLKANPAKVRNMVEQVASGYEDPAAIMKWYYSDQTHLKEIEALALEEMVIDWVLGHANVTEKSYTFSEVMNKRQIAG